MKINTDDKTKLEIKVKNLAVIFIKLFLIFYPTCRYNDSLQIRNVALCGCAANEIQSDFYYTMFPKWKVHIRVFFNSTYLQVVAFLLLINITVLAFSNSVIHVRSLLF